MTLSGWARLRSHLAVAVLLAAMTMAGCVIGKWRSYAPNRGGAEKAIAMLNAQSKRHMGIEFSHRTGSNVNLYAVTELDDDRICGDPAGVSGDAIVCYSFADIMGDLRVWDSKGNALDAVVDTLTLPARAAGKITP